MTNNSVTDACDDSLVFPQVLDQKSNLTVQFQQKNCSKVKAACFSLTFASLIACRWKRFQKGFPEHERTSIG
jgi:hypothetical protein